MSHMPLASAERRGTVVTDWALYSKVPGRKMDYEIRAASMDAALAERCIRSVLAGTPEGRAEGRPEALPWYGFTGRLGDRPAFALMELSWSEERDFTGQPITPARLLVADHAGAARESLTCTRLAAALFEIRWRDIHAGPPGIGDRPMRLILGAADAPAADVERLGVDFVGTVAALVLDGAQIVFTAAEHQYPAVAERLRILDAVYALLPYAYRHYLSAATWASHRARHRISLTFAERAATGQVEVPLDGRAMPQPQSDEAQAYARVLAGLLKKGKTVTQIAQHLAAQTQLDLCRGPADAVDLLQRMDLPGLVLRAIEDGRADLGEVAAVLDRFRFEGLDDEHMRQRYCGYLLDKVVRDGADAAPAWTVLAGAWSPYVAAALTDRLYAALTAGDRAALDRLAALLAGLPPDAAKQVVRRLTAAVAAHPRPEDIAAHTAVLAQLSSDVGNDEEVHRTFLLNAPAGIELALCLFGTARALEQVLARWEPLATGDETRWARPIIAAARGEMTSTSGEDFVWLNELLPEATLTVMTLASRNDRLVPLFQVHSGALATLGQRLRLTGSEESRATFRARLIELRTALYTDVGRLRAADFKDHGRLDVVLMLAGMDSWGVLNLTRLPTAFLSAMGQLWRNKVLDQVRPYLVQQLEAALVARGGQLRDNEDVYDVVGVVDRVEPSLRPRAAALISAYLGTNIEQRNALELSLDWAALIDPWLRRIVDLARVCADPGSTLHQVVSVLRTLMDEPVVDYAQVLDALRPWLQPGREVDAIQLIRAFRWSGDAQQEEFGQVLLDSLTNPGGPLRQFAPHFNNEVRAMTRVLEEVRRSVDRYQPPSAQPALADRPWSQQARVPHQALPQVPPQPKKGKKKRFGFFGGSTGGEEQL
ncbi:hypothetical protein AB0M46_16770 [Dactylosporangium sp. NPDC051485]|uniref:hypothetical protein n=1 Tax=Dactylosporangium sp. NPDC051485 TaxID=3154846 RepID=UPI003434268D